MNMRFYLLLIAIISVFSPLRAQKKFIVHTVAFYNFENLFDTINDPLINDDEWTPIGAQRWTSRRYLNKLDNLARVLSEIGTGDNPEPPAIIGGAEIENRQVLEDLVKNPKLVNLDYGIVHFDSPDNRGIDVALLYRKKYFKPISFKKIPLLIYNDVTVATADKEKDKEKEEITDDKSSIDLSTSRVFTRDQLLVTGILDGEEVSFIVNHWPSRSGGEKKSSPFREAAGALNRRIIDSLFQRNPNAKVMTMGDLNDGTYNRSVRVALGAKVKKELVRQGDVYNPFDDMFNKGMGTIAHRDAWDIFDQIIFSEAFLGKDYSSFKFWKAGIYNKPYLIQTTGQYKGYPLRHSTTEEGFSDHFAVYVYLVKELKK
jgi:hypothetical protein